MLHQTLVTVAAPRCAVKLSGADDQLPAAPAPPLYICKMVMGVMGRAHFGRKPHWSEKALWAFFAGFPKFVPSERQESFGSPAFFHVKWALLRLSLIFVPFLAQSRDAKTEKKGTKMKILPESARFAISQPRIPLEYVI